MRKIIFLVLLLINLAAFGQEPPYNKMKSNYKFRGIRVDTLMMMPSFPDTATANSIGLGSITGSHIRVDSIIYTRFSNRWTKVSGTDTLSLSNRINSKADTSLLNGVVYFADTLSIIATKSDLTASIDTTSLSDRINDKIDSLKRIESFIYFKKNGEWLYGFRDSVGGVDTSSLSNRINLKLNISDTASMLTKYLRKTDTTSLSNRINLKVNISDTASMLSGYAKTSAVNLKVNISDTSAMLNKYLRKSDTTSLSSRIDNKIDSINRSSINVYFYKNGVQYLGFTDSLGITDTANKFVNSVIKLNDSTIRVVKGNSTTDITLTSSATITSASRLSTQVYNNTGVTISKGSVVYITGRHSSNYPTIALAQANNEASSYKTFALVESDISNSSVGTAIQLGNISNLNLPTSSYTDGDLVYLSPTTAGGITITKPSAPNHIVKLGSVTRAHPTLGSIQINIQNGWQLDELSDVKISAVPADSTLFQFSRVDSLWHDVSVINAIGTKYIKPSDTASMLTQYLRRQDSSIYQPKYRSDTMRTNIYATLNGKLNVSDSSIYQPKYRTDTMRTNLYNALNGKQATLTNPVTGTGTSGNLTKFNGTSSVTNASVDVDYLQQDMSLVALQAMGSSIKAYTIGCPIFSSLTAGVAFSSGRVYFCAVYIPKAVTLTGVKWLQSVQGSYTANNYNGIGLYSVSGGTLTLVASSTNDGNIWQQGTGLQSKAFSSTYAASAGVYYIAAAYSISTGTTAPNLYVTGSTATGSAFLNSFDFTNSQVLFGVITSATSLPSTQSLSGLSTNTGKIPFYLY